MYPGAVALCDGLFISPYQFFYSGYPDIGFISVGVPPAFAGGGQQTSLRGGCSPAGGGSYAAGMGKAAKEKHAMRAFLERTQTMYKMNRTERTILEVLSIDRKKGTAYIIGAVVYRIECVQFKITNARNKTTHGNDEGDKR